ncbi:hypothetical protein HY522_04270 [bacterium]|nr:hypothetical protein [bacterium]
MGKSNGSNNLPWWAKRDLQVLKRVSVSLVDMQRQARQDMAETRRDMVEMRHENQKMFAEMVRRNDRLEEQTASLKKVSDIHTKAIMRILDKI